MIGDEDTVRGLRPLHALQVPGTALAIGGGITLAVGAGAFAVGVAVLVGEMVVCVFSFGLACETSGSGGWFRTSGLIALGGAIGAGAGLLILAGTTAAIAPHLRLLEWYTRDEVQARIAEHNDALRRELGLPEPQASAWRARSLDLVVRPGGVALVAAF